jgi:hypothetical protein
VEKGTGLYRQPDFRSRVVPGGHFHGDRSKGKTFPRVIRYFGTRRSARQRIYKLRHYGAGNLRAKVAKLRTRAVQLRVPIKLKLTVAFVLLISVTLMIVSFFVLQRQQEALYQETVKTGKVSLAYFTSNAKVPLLDDNILELNAIVKEAKSVEGLLYAFIVGSDGKIVPNLTFRYRK